MRSAWDSVTVSHKHTEEQSGNRSEQHERCQHRYTNTSLDNIILGESISEIVNNEIPLSSSYLPPFEIIGVNNVQSMGYPMGVGI